MCNSQNVKEQIGLRERHRRRYIHYSWYWWVRWVYT